MTLSPPSFSETLQRAAEQHQLQMLRAASTVRAHVAPDDGLDSMLDCLGLTEAQNPAGV